MLLSPQPYRLTQKTATLPQPVPRPRPPPIPQRERSTSAPNVCMNLVNTGDGTVNFEVRYTHGIIVSNPRASLTATTTIIFQGADHHHRPQPVHLYSNCDIHPPAWHLTSYYSSTPPHTTHASSSGYHTAPPTSLNQHQHWLWYI